MSLGMSGGGGGRSGARVAVKMEVSPFYGEEGLELLPDFAQLPGFGGGAAGLEAADESRPDPPHKLLLAGKKAPPPPHQPPRDLVGAASGSGPFASLRPRGVGSAAAAAVHRLIPEVPAAAAAVGPGGLQPLLKLPPAVAAASDLEELLIQAGGPPASPPDGGGGGGGGGGPSTAAAPPSFLYRPPQPPPQQQQQEAAAAAAGVTQEQEGFADGFVKALADLHKQNQLLGVPLSPPQHPPCCPPPSRQDSPAVYTTLGGFDPGSPPATAAAVGGGGGGGGGGAFFARLPGPGLEEPQTVPEAVAVSVSVVAPPALSSGESPPPPPPPPPPSSSLSPLDAESQERLKAERKRLRNRIAASKCRRRKLERIARLEEKVKALKGQNAELAATASLLRAQVSQLQGRVRSHLSSGCHINANPAPAQASGQPPGREAPTEPEASAC